MPDDACELLPQAGGPGAALIGVVVCQDCKSEVPVATIHAACRRMVAWLELVLTPAI